MVRLPRRTNPSTRPVTVANTIAGGFRLPSVATVGLRSALRPSATPEKGVLPDTGRRLRLTGARTTDLRTLRRLSSDHGVSGQSDRKSSGLRSGVEIGQPSQTLAL